MLLLDFQEKGVSRRKRSFRAIALNFGLFHQSFKNPTQKVESRTTVQVTEPSAGYAKY
jgi:hypothetical protein